MDTQIVAALIGGAATIIAAVITLRAATRRGGQTPAEDDEPAPRRPLIPEVWSAKVREFGQRLAHDPLGTILEAVIHLALLVVGVGVAVYVVILLGRIFFDLIRGALR